MRTLPTTAAVLTALVMAAGAGRAQVPAQGSSQEPPAASAASPPSADPASPRAAVERFLRLTRASAFERAAEHLEPLDGGSVPAERARRVGLVLDRMVSIETDGLPGKDDGRERIEIGVIRLEGGVTVPIRLVRRPSSTGEVRWLFSRDTLVGVDDAWDVLPHRALLEHLPNALVRAGPRGALWYQWLLLAPLLVCAWAIGWLASRLVRALLQRITRRTAAAWDEHLAQRLGAPLTLGLTVAASVPLLPWLALPPAAKSLVQAPLDIVVLVAVFWGLLRAVDVAVARFLEVWATTRPGSRALLPLGGRIAKAVLVGIGAIAVVSTLGYPIASILAGLGIGGLAVALAAQKTFENLFGAFAVGIDQPLREGDFVGVDDFVGTVESIGLRSTRIRTLDRTLITIPNGQLAEKRIESYAERDRIRLFVKVGLVYTTTSSQMGQVLDGIVTAIRAHPDTWPDNVIARFVGFGDSSLDVEVMAWFNTTDFDRFCRIRSEVLVKLMEVVESTGTSFAFPTRTVHLASTPS